MTTAYSTNLGLALPVQGELSGTWGDTVNNGITQYSDIAIAGTQTISSNQTAVTLSLTNGTAAASNIAQVGGGATGSAQYAIINCTGNPAGLLTVTVPASSRQYVVINATSTNQSVKVVGVGPTTGVTIAPGERVHIAWNGSDYVRVAGDVVGPASATSGDLVAFDGTTGRLIKAASTVTVAQGGTGASTLTANNVILGNGTSAVQFVAPGTSGNVLTSNGTTWTSAPAPAGGASATPTVAGSVFGKTVNASTYDVFLGYQAGAVNAAAGNTFVGFQAGFVNTSGSYNTAVGYKSLDANSTGQFNVAVGGDALGSMTGGSRNIAVGYGALFGNLTGDRNIAIGSSALAVNTASYNVAIGQDALLNNASGTNNVAVGTSASLNNSTGSGLVAVGTSALSATTGTANTAVGYQAGYAVTTGTQNVLVGNNAAYSGVNNLTTGSNNIVIGYNTETSSATVSNEVTIGSTSITSTRLRGMVQVNAAMLEQATVSASTASGTINFDSLTQSVLYYTNNASGNWTMNFRANSGTSLNAAMVTGQSMTVAFLATQGGSAYYNNVVQVDGNVVTPKWQGGTAPTSGNASSVDVYVYTIIKTANATFSVFASQTKFA